MPRSVLPLLALALFALVASTAACTGGDAPDFPYELYLARVDGGRPTLVARSMNPHNVAWSWDSKSFAYIREQTIRDSELRVTTLQHKTMTIDLVGRAYEAVLSPGGYIALFEEFDNPRASALVAISPDGRQRTELDRSNDALTPYWIVGWADDSRLIVSRDYGEVSVLTEYHPDGTNRAFDVLPIAVGSPRPSFSPDRSHVVWGDLCGLPGLGDGVWLLGLSDGAARQISQMCSVVDLEWSPDGRQLAAVVRVSGGGGGLFVLDLASGTEWRVTQSPQHGEDEGVHWVDGGFLLYRVCAPRVMTAVRLRRSSFRVMARRNSSWTTRRRS